ncbi:hypothetical protein G6F65_015696 [Rhizopus arrhizus]|nr:hypothetical protein G6F65_015696 [Rhizopus arrhizus]
MRLHPPAVAFDLVSTLLKQQNLHAFRAAFSTIMRGVANLRADANFQAIHGSIDALLDRIPEHSGYLLNVDTSLLHYLRCLRFISTAARARYIRHLFDSTQHDAVRRGCVDCWRGWKDRAAFNYLRNRWAQLTPECQRIFWLASYDFGDEGEKARLQARHAIAQSWALGIELPFDEKKDKEKLNRHPRGAEPRFAKLTPGIVSHFNASAENFPIREIPPHLLAESRLQRAMLFELGYTVGEFLLQGVGTIDWMTCFQDTLRRQRVYFDAKLPETLEPQDQKLAEIVGSNLAHVLSDLSKTRMQKLVIRPSIAGLEWIASGCGDFSLGRTLIEVKCTAKRFSAADYRQIAIYWMLSYAAAVENRGDEWQDFILFNPRSGQMVTMKFDTFLNILSSGRTKVDILQLFLSLVGSRLMR